MDKSAVKQEALRRVLDSLNAPGVQSVETPQATCPSCGHTWTSSDESSDPTVAHQE